MFAVEILVEGTEGKLAMKVERDCIGHFNRKSFEYVLIE